jgi:hypothetical protein
VIAPSCLSAVTSFARVAESHDEIQDWVETVCAVIHANTMDMVG